MARNKYDIDELIEDKFDLNQLKRVFQYVKPYRSQLALALFLMLSASALTMLFPLFISEIMDTYIPEKKYPGYCHHHTAVPCDRTVHLCVYPSQDTHHQPHRPDHRAPAPR